MISPFFVFYWLVCVCRLLSDLGTNWSHGMEKVKGFTLIELMIVVSIIGILSWVAVPKYQNYLLRATATAQFSAAIRPIQNALAEYVAYNGSFPTSFSELAQIGFVDHQGKAYSSSTDFAVGSVSGVTLTFPDSNSDELLIGVAFNCQQVEPSGCSKVAPKQLQPLTLEVNARFNQLKGTLVYMIDKSRAANLAFQGFLPRL